jgi:hypothetical protein
LTLTEARATGDAAIRQRMITLVDDFLVLPMGEEARQLAREYVGRGVFSAATAVDALHVAIAVAACQDMLVSWNFRLRGIPRDRDPRPTGSLRRARAIMFDYVAAAQRVGIPGAKLVSCLRSHWNNIPEWSVLPVQGRNVDGSSSSRPPTSGIATH